MFAKPNLRRPKIDLGILLFCFFAFVSVTLIARRLIPKKLFDLQFDVGEWLINYKGGFVRRGLFGEVLLHVFNLREPYAGYALILIQIILYLTIIIYLFQFIRRNIYSWSSIALCCSPAVGIFVFNNYGLTRKELLGLFSLVIMATSSKKNQKKFSLSAWIAVIMFGISCFSSEINALLLPSFLYVLDVSHEQFRKTLIYRLQKISLIAISFISFGLSVIFHGNSQIVKLLCEDVRSHGFPEAMCNGSGAIDWLGVNISEVGPLLMHQFPLYFWYLPLIFLAILPIVSTPWFRSNLKWVLACTLFIAPLYLIALDYGRWTFMLASEIVIMIIATKNVLIENEYWNKFSVPIFVFGWGLPFYASSESNLKDFLLGHNFFYICFKILKFTYKSLFL